MEFLMKMPLEKYISGRRESQPVEIKFEPFDVTFYGNLLNVGGFMMEKHPFCADKFHFSEVSLHFENHGLLWAGSFVTISITNPANLPTLPRLVFNRSLQKRRHHNG
jgi:hypothetical protein